MPFIAFSQDRIDSELPKIEDTLASIKTAKGWIKNNIGKWVNLPNAIPSDNNAPWPCYEFVEYSLLKISFKNESYFCLIHKKRSEINFYILNFFIHRKMNSEDTLLRYNLNVLHSGQIYNGNRLKETLINEIFKKFEEPNSYNINETITIDLSVNKVKSYMRFFISGDYTISCGEEENPLEKKYFESPLINLRFFEALLSE